MYTGEVRVRGALFIGPSRPNPAPSPLQAVQVYIHMLYM